MRSFIGVLSLLALYISSAAATALTYRLVHNEKSCFFTETNRRDAKVAFYFAVQSGGNFEIDYEVRGPNNKLVMAGEKERQGDFVFTAQDTGEYRFCFSNEGYTASDKDVDFEIAVEVSRSQCEECVQLTDTGRIPLRAPPRERRHVARTDIRTGGYNLQGQLSIINSVKDAEIFPDARKSKFQYGAEHREQDLQLQHDRGCDDGWNGCFAGFGGQVLLPGCEEGICMIRRIHVYCIGWEAGLEETP